MSFLKIEPKEGVDIHFREDLRQPEVTFGRCALTGEFADCVSIDLGNLSIQAPVTTEGVDYDPVTGQCNFNVWKPEIFEQSLTVSRAGLERLLAFMDTQGSVIPTITPVLHYKWEILYNDGNTLGQFEYSEAGAEQMRHTGDVEWNRVHEIRIIPRDTPNEELPTYSFAAGTGKFYRNGVELDTYFDGEMPEGALPVYARENTISLGSVLKPNSLNRSIDLANVAVLQCFGWIVGGWAAGKEAKCCVIAVDSRGSWRPFRYNE